MATDVKLQAAGLYTDPSAEQTPEGALAEATNVVIRRPGIIEPRYGIGPLSSNPLGDYVTALWAYGGYGFAATLDKDTNARTIYRWNGSTWTAITGYHNSPGFADATDYIYTTKNAVARKNCYVTGGQGIIAQVGNSGTAGVPAGRPVGLSGTITTSATTPHSYEAGTVVAYRATFKRLDANDVLTEGPPSARFYYSGSSSTALSITVPLPASLVIAGDYVRLYRAATIGSDVTVPPPASTQEQRQQAPNSFNYNKAHAQLFGGASASGHLNTSPASQPAAAGAVTQIAGTVPYNTKVEPTDEMQLVAEQRVTSTDVSNGYVTIVDNVVAQDLGALLYTSPSQDGIFLANYTPPVARSLALYQGTLFFGNITDRGRLPLRLLKCSVNWASGTNALGYSTGMTGTTGAGTFTITSISPNTTNLAVGQLVTGTGISANTTITSVDSSTQVTLSKNTTAGVGTALTFRDAVTIGYDGTSSVTVYANSSEDVANKYFKLYDGDAASTASSLAYVVNRSAIGVGVMALPSGGVGASQCDVLIEEVGVGGGEASYLPYAKCQPRAAAWLAPGSDFSATTHGTADSFLHGLSWSKIDEPEHVPLAYRTNIGAADKRLLALATTTDGLYIFKEDGLWRLTGTSPADFRIDPMDPTLRLVNAQAVGTMNNTVFAWTNRGLVGVAGLQVQVLSDPIKNSLLQIQSKLQQYPAAKGAFIVCNPLEQEVQLHYPSSVTASAAAGAYVLNCTGAWTYHDIQWMCGAYSEVDGSVYYGSVNSQVSKQRRSFGSDVDYYDLQGSVTYSAVSGTSITVNDTSNLTVGDVLSLNNANPSTVYIIKEVTDGTHVKVHTDASAIGGTGTLYYYTGYTCTVRWVDQYFGAPYDKIFLSAALNWGEYQRVYQQSMSFATDLVSTYQSYTETNTSVSQTSGVVYNHGVPIAREAARGTLLRPKLVIRQAAAPWALQALVLSYDWVARQPSRRT